MIYGPSQMEGIFGNKKHTSRQTHNFPPFAKNHPNNKKHVPGILLETIPAFEKPILNSGGVRARARARAGARAEERERAAAGAGGRARAEA